MILPLQSDNGYVWQNLTGHRAIVMPFATWNLTQLHALRCMNNNLRGHLRIEIPYPTPHSGHIITWNPAPACNIFIVIPASCLCFQLKSQITRREKSEIPHPAKPIRDPVTTIWFHNVTNNPAIVYMQPSLNQINWSLNYFAKIL